jgi:hypothetical protein
VSDTRRSTSEYSKRPNDKVHQGIIQTLSEFGTLTRYYNLDLLAGGRAAKLPEPVGHGGIESAGPFSPNITRRANVRRIMQQPTVSLNC